ncbi:MAG: MATE family efflux transporter [Clostridia bacterium]|nr:MATE family efflux transporter [Clostridia bacterium]
MTNDLTKGSPIKQIFLFSIPYLIGNLFQQFYNIADMVIVGRTLDALAYTAVGATSSLVWFASGAIQSLTLGFSALTARYFGANDEEGIKRSFAASIKLSAIISVLLAVVCTLFARPILELLRTPDDIIDRSYAYIVWIFAGLVATALFNLLSNMIRALGDSKTPLCFLIIACLINIVLDVVFIAFFGMDTDGAGLATVLAQLISGVFCIGYIKKRQPLLHFSERHFKNDRTLDIQLLKVGMPMAFLNMVLSIGGIVMQFVTNGLGTLYVSAQTTGAKIVNFVTQPLLSFSSALSVFTAQNYGAKKYLRLVDGGKKTLYLGFAWSTIASVIMLLCGRFLVVLLAGEVAETVVDNAQLYIVISTLCSFFLTPLVVWKAVLQSIGRSTSAMISGFTEIAARAGLSLGVIALMSAGLVSEGLGFVFICFCDPFAWLIGMLTVLFEYTATVKEFKRHARATGESLG